VDGILERKGQVARGQKNENESIVLAFIHQEAMLEKIMIEQAINALLMYAIVDIEFILF